jgi:hypothetical protein
MAQTKNVDVTHITEPMVKATTLVLAQPFDLARSLYALAVRFGLIENSLLTSARFGRDICSLEKMTLGPWARQV